MTDFSRLFLLPLLGALVLSAPVARAEDEEPAATPYRPSVSSPAALPVPGWLDMEFGWQRATGGDDKRRESVPVAAKLAFNPDWGIVVGSELQVRRVDQSDAVFSGGGDTTFLVKHRIATADADTAWGIAAGVKSPTAKNTIGSGKSDAIVNGIFSTDLADSYHLDANLTATHVGAWGEGESRLQHGWAVAVSRSINDQWGIFAEPSGTHRRGTPVAAQLLVGANYNASKRLVFDVAVARRMSAAGPDWQVMAGMTLLVGRVW